jgi:hypothetical protein
MWVTAILGFLQGWPKFLDLIEKGIAAYSARTAELQEQRVAKSQKDMNAAKTTEEIEKATDEQAEALRHL